jgi:hydroxyethylthiazole kinase-like uncharacterized protein yjeF
MNEAEERIIMNRDEVRAFDSWAINKIGIPGVVLMENAGRTCAELIKERLKDIPAPKVSIFCGTGNNGGDGYVIARHLINSDYDITVVICGDKSKIKGDAKINLEILQRMDCNIEQLDLKGENISEQVTAFAANPDMIVDAIFGTGLKGVLRGEYKELIDSINYRGCPILAVDIPSGLDCDTGRPLDTAIKAELTVTFAAVKEGFTNAESAQYTGRIYVASIGIEPR